MKTLLECKDAIAHRHGYQSWGEMHVDLKDWKSRAHELAELYASQFREPSSPTVKESETVEQEEMWKEVEMLCDTYGNAHLELQTRFIITRKI